jgi:signal transduction histidine kinase
VETMLVVSGEPFPMDQPTTRAIAMIVREAVFNAILHANAESIRVELDFSPEELTLAVSDDGQGFAMTSSHWEDHYGIMGMRERVDHFGGTFRIESAPGNGTSVRIHIPQERVQVVSQ